MNPDAGWYPDPEIPTAQRYWDGTAWTEHRHSPSAAEPPPEEASAGLSEPAARRPVAAIVVGSVVALAAVAGIGWWLLARGDDANDAAGSDGVAAVIDGTQRWSTDLGLGDDAEPMGILATDGDVVVLGARDDDRKQLVALDVADGSVLWQRDFEPRVTDPARIRIVNGVVLASTDEPTATILAIDVRTGDVRWEQAVGLLSTWSVVDGRVVSHDDRAVIVRDISTGEVEFDVALGDSGSFSVSRDAVVVASYDRDTESTALRAFSFDGSERWETSIDGPLRLTDLQPDVSPVAIIAVTLDELIGLDPASVEVLWRTPNLDVAPPVLVDHAGDRALLCELDDDGLRLESIELSSGAEAWALQIPTSSSGEPTVVGITDEVVVVSDSSDVGLCRTAFVRAGRIEGYSLADGRRVWQMTVSADDNAVLLPLLSWDHAQSLTPGMAIGGLLLDESGGAERLLDPNTGEVIHEVGAGSESRVFLLGDTVAFWEFSDSSTTLSIAGGRSLELGPDQRVVGVADGVAYLLGMDGTLVAID
ncbi:MAG: PQQ-binding-like beta-propeller repeat protein [Acidimicrobiales bacterium]|nr:PQQ-binding-like beta-propeller repeat protein [Acidimicrobiales bacterium]